MSLSTRLAEEGGSETAVGRPSFDRPTETKYMISVDKGTGPSKPRFLGFLFLFVTSVDLVNTLGLLVFLIWNYIIVKQREGTIISLVHEDIIYDITVSGFVIRLVFYILKAVIMFFSIISAFILNTVFSIIVSVLLTLVGVFDILLLVFAILGLVQNTSDGINNLNLTFGTSTPTEPLLFVGLDAIVLVFAIFLTTALVKHRIQLKLHQKKQQFI